MFSKMIISVVKKPSLFISGTGGKISFTTLAKIHKGKVECYNFFCIGKGYFREKGFLKVSEILVSLVQIRDYYCEIAIRCPYCRNLMASFGLEGFDCGNKKILPDLDWQKVIFKIREEWQELHRVSTKIILNYNEYRLR